MGTTTVRISDDARARLEAVAGVRHQALTTTLNRIIADAWWQEAARIERAALGTDLENPSFVEEMADWDSTTGDCLAHLD